MNVLPDIDNFKKNEVLVIVDDIGHRLTVDLADVKIMDNITGFRELGNMIKYGLMTIYQYKIIFVMIGRFDLMTSHADYSDGFRYTMDIIRERNEKAVIVLCPCIIGPKDAPSERVLASRRGLALALFAHENIGYAFCRPTISILESNDPISKFFDVGGDVNEEGVKVIKSKISGKLQDGTLFHLYKFMENL